ncbi:hypothetical protein [Roseovarius sp. 2305UL8-3]|uniref:hypothetical protein n=1 Tax=Roseovarius conchicola TaxID=3121636 RepID=UPI0035270E4B
MKPFERLLDLITRDPVDLLAYFLPGAAALLLVLEKTDWLNASVPTGWASQPLWLIGFVVVSWVIGILFAYASHLLNVPYDYLANRRREVVGDPKRDRARALAGAALGKGDSAYHFAKTALGTSKHKELLGDADKLEAVSKFFRTVCFASLMFAFWAAISGMGWGIVAVALVVAGLSWRIFYDQRWAASQTLYQGYITLKDQD